MTVSPAETEADLRPRRGWAISLVRHISDIAPSSVDRLFRRRYALLVLAGALTVVLVALLVLVPPAHGRNAVPAGSAPPAAAELASAAPAQPGAPAVADIVARAMALKSSGQIAEALQVIEDAMQLPEAPHILTDPELHWLQGWLLISLSETTGRHMYVLDAEDEFKAVVLLAGSESDLGREAQRAVDRISKRE